MCKLRVWWPYYIGTSHTSRSPYYEKFCTTKVTILWLYIVQNVQVASMVTVLYRHQSHITITILWKILYYQGHHTVTLHSTKCASCEYGDCTIQAPVTHHDHHTMKNFVLPRSPYCDLVQNVQVASMVTVLYRHQSHITITILWKILYYQGHHTVTLHSAKCASCEYGNRTI